MESKTTVKYVIHPKGKTPRGTVIPKNVTEEEAKKVIKTGKYTFNIWPDNDCFNYYDTLEAKVIKTTTTVEKEIFCK